MGAEPASEYPKHVAIIMDGNGRWAKARGYPRFYGHIRGSSRVREIVTAARERGIRALTLYAFSTENWKRPEQELAVLWGLLRKYLRREIRTLKANGIRLQVIGDTSRLPAEARNELQQTIESLGNENGMVLTLALSYGGRDEIVGAARALARKCVNGELKPEAIDEPLLESFLSTAGLGEFSDVDLMIRTSGEKRISNYLLWQCSYAEFDFPDTLWPDYSVEEFSKSLETFKHRQRRFGGI